MECAHRVVGPLDLGKIHFAAIADEERPEFPIPAGVARCLAGQNFGMVWMQSKLLVEQWQGRHLSEGAANIGRRRRPERVQRGAQLRVLRKRTP